MSVVGLKCHRCLSRMEDHTVYAVICGECLDASSVIDLLKLAQAINREGQVTVTLDVRLIGGRGGE